jgi:hypothetical protein
MRTIFFSTWILFFLQMKVIPSKIVPWATTVTETLFPLFATLLEGFCWKVFQLVGYSHLDIIQIPQSCPFKCFLTRGNKKKPQGTRSGE